MSCASGTEGAAVDLPGMREVYPGVCKRSTRAAACHLAEDAALQDRSVADGPADAQPQAPGIRRGGADADRQRADDRASGEEDRAAVDPAGVLVQQIVDVTAGHAHTHVHGAVADRRDVLQLPQIARADGPVIAHAQLADLQARKA